MNVTDLPRPSTHAVYDEAITKYAERVGSRAIGVYRVGHIRTPGLSDIDLLVVTDRVVIDNRHFFSPFERLPEKYHSLFLHEPYVLPAWSLRVLQHTTHYSPALLAGRDVLHQFSPSDSPDERWCRMLESYCSYAQFAADARSTETLRGRQTMTAANSYRYLLADAQAVLPQAVDATYIADMDRMSATFFDRPDRERAVEDAWERFSKAFNTFEAALRELTNTSSADDTLKAVHELLRGDREVPHFDREYAFRRWRDIDGYHQELASLGFPYGQLFFTAAHPQAVRALPEPPVVTNLIRNLYRVRRRLAEYAMGA